MTSEPARNPPDKAAGRVTDGTVIPLRRPAGAQSACPLARCDGTGWIETDDRAVEPCECRSITRNRSRARGLASAIPARFRGVSFDRPPLADMARAPESRHAVAAVREFTDDIDARLDAGESLWLTGGVGTGKTTLAMTVSAAAAQAGRSVAIYSLPKLLARIRRTYDAVAGEDSYLAFFERLASVDLLHIDDLGAEKRSDWVLEQLYAIVDERYGAERSMIVTTNLDETDLEEQIGGRTVSRLVEMCGDLGPLRVEGRDNRY
jgi:DNA replication protein DnaC